MGRLLGRTGRMKPTDTKDPHPLAQPEVVALLGEVGEELGDAPVVGLEERLEGQDGGELTLGEVLATPRGGVRRQGVPGQPERLPGDRPRGSGHRCVRLHVTLGPVTRRKDSTEQRHE